MVWIDDGTASKLRQPTERVRDGGPGYIGNLEMFHQLHCLVCALAVAAFQIAANVFLLESHPETIL